MMTNHQPDSEALRSTELCSSQERVPVCSGKGARVQRKLPSKHIAYERASHLGFLPWAGTFEAFVCVLNPPSAPLG